MFICKVLNYVYVNDGETEIRNAQIWRDFYNCEDNLDNLFVGSSHIFRDVNVGMMDQINNKNNMDLSTGSQRLIGSYYSIKEAIHYNDISCVYLEMYYAVSIGESGDFDNKKTMKNNWRIIDNMRFSINKLNYICNACGKDILVETFFPFTRYRSKLFNAPYIKELLDYKSTLEYKIKYYEKTDTDGKILYRTDPKGYVYVESEFDEKNYIFPKYMEKEIMTEDAKIWLEKIINLCNENNVDIVLFSSPMPDINLIAYGYYDEYVNDIIDIADRYDVPYYDFNLAKEKYLPIQQYQYFGDDDHLNALGTELFTPFLWKVVSGEISGDDVFYDSFEEKLENSAPQIFGIVTSECENSINYEISTNYSEKYEYRIICDIEGGEQVMVQDFSDKTSFERPKEEHGLITIVVRDSTDLNSVVTREFNY